MIICRFNHDHLGLIEGDTVYDVSQALDVLKPIRWPGVLGDPLVEHIGVVSRAIQALLPRAASVPLGSVRLNSPVVGASKVLAAPANYRLHVAIDTKDPGLDHGVHAKAFEGVDRPVDKYGLFLKATSSITGPGDGIQIVFPDRRTDHEIELAVIIGRRGKNIPRERAYEHIAAYTIGLDMTVRGVEDRSFRKSPDGYTMLGPALVTADQIPDPSGLEMKLWVNGELRQSSSTSAMTVDIPDLIAFASRAYTLHPGDVILTGTPEGVGPVVPGDIITASCSGIGQFSCAVRA